MITVCSVMECDRPALNSPFCEVHKPKKYSLPQTTMHQYAPWPHELQQAVDEFHYMEGWTFKLEDITRDWGDPKNFKQPIAGGLTMVIFVPCQDSYHPERYRPVNHYHPVPAATYNRQAWERWIFDRLIDTLTHEAGEWARFEKPGLEGFKKVVRQRRPFAALHGPGDNPYVVHEPASELQRNTSYRGEIKES